MFGCQMALRWGYSYVVEEGVRHPIASRDWRDVPIRATVRSSLPGIPPASLFVASSFPVLRQSRTPALRHIELTLALSRLLAYHPSKSPLLLVHITRTNWLWQSTDLALCGAHVRLKGICSSQTVYLNITYVFFVFPMETLVNIFIWSVNKYLDNNFNYFLNK